MTQLRDGVTGLLLASSSAFDMDAMEVAKSCRDLRLRAEVVDSDLVLEDMDAYL
jgi:hypothetical protein